MIRKTLKKLVYGLQTRWHASGKRQEILAIDHRVELMRAGDGPPLLYLHSVLGETRWLPFHQRLATGFDVIAPSHPGLGTTEGADEIDSIEDVVFHYLDVLDGLGFERTHVVGVSFGGWIAAEFAVRHPDRVDRLVLADAFGLMLDEHPIPALFSESRDVAAMRELLFADPTGPMADVALPRRRAGQEQPAGELRALEVFARLGREPYMHDPKLARRLRRISRPTLVLWGERDPILPLAYAEAYRDLIPNAELRVLRDCGHLPQFERGDAFVSAVSEFLKR